MTKAARICVARIGAAHGVRGEVRLWSFTEDPLAVTQYGPLTTKDGARSFEVVRARAAKDHLVATLKGVTTRDEAERINGLELYVTRDKLPPTDDDEYYHADLIGLRAENPDGSEIGKVVAMHNFGAGDIIEIGTFKGPSLMLPFSNAVVPAVDIKGGTVTIILPTEIEGDTPSKSKANI